MRAEGVEEADSLVEPQRGNEKNKQPLPVPLWLELSNTLIPPNITLAEKSYKHPLTFGFSVQCELKLAAYNPRSIKPVVDRYLLVSSCLSCDVNISTGCT